MSQGSFDELDPAAFGTPAVPGPEAGYRAPTVTQIVGITYRQLDYWARTDLVTPSITPAAGSGTQRLYSFADILVLKVVKGLLDTGISLPNIRTAVAYLRAHSATDLATTTLVCDGTTIYDCTDDEQIIDLLHGGQGVFGIAIGRTLRDLSATITAFPADPGTVTVSTHVDELAHRRSRIA